ncbi:MAG: N-acetyltransferase [Candidatus Bathyarchaeota archaeon]|nr:MAG: N-acetyltransferase [Candidatus Bathyarchaeota archaeon]
MSNTIKTGQFTIIRDAEIGEKTVIWHHCNLFGCRIGKNCKIGSYVEIGPGSSVGDDCKIEAFAYICSGVTIGNKVFIGPHVTFINDKYPKAVGDWKIVPTLVESGASIGANTTILCGVTIGKNSLIAAGSMVTKDVPSNTWVAGNPARPMKRKTSGAS